MRKLVITLSSCILANLVFAQVAKQINIPKYKNGDTSLWYKWNIPLVGELELQNLINSTDTFHFRFWADGQAIDIWTNNNKTFFGQITNYTKTYESFNIKKQERKPSKIFSTQIQLDTSLARQTFELIKTIIEIPSEDSIKGWSNGFDGITYLIEMSTQNFYSFKYYWTPLAQDSSLIEAKQIQSFVDKLYSSLNLQSEYDKFFDSLPAGSYTNDNYLIRTKLTEKQKRKFARYKKRHSEK